MTVRLTGWIAPAPMPWINRNAIKDGMDQAKPHSAEPTRNTVIPASSTGLRPNRSASLPKITVVAVCVSRKEENTQAYRCRSPSCPAICGIAVDTMVASMAIMKVDAMTAATTSGRLVVRGMALLFIRNGRTTSHAAAGLSSMA